MSIRFVLAIYRTVIMHSVVHKTEQAHDEGIWTCSWRRNKETSVDYVVTGSLDNAIKVWKWEDESLKFQYQLDAHRLGVISTDIDPDGKYAVSSSTECSLKVWQLDQQQIDAVIDPDVDSGKPAVDVQCSIDCGAADSWTVRFHPDGDRVATGGQGGRIRIHSLSAQQQETGAGESAIAFRSFDTGGGGKFILSVAFSPDGRHLAAASQEGIIYIYDLQTESLISTVEGHAMPIRSLAFTPDSKVLLSASDDKYAKMHDIVGSSGSQVVATFPGHTGWVLSVDASPIDGRQFATGSADKTVKCWDMGERRCVHTFQEHSDQVWGVAYGPNGSRLLSVSEDKSAIVYNIPV